MTQNFLYSSICTTKAFTFTTASIVVGRYHIEISSGTRFYFIFERYFSNVDFRGKNIFECFISINSNQPNSWAHGSNTKYYIFFKTLKNVMSETYSNMKMHS